jgi:hypothetical protein
MVISRFQVFHKNGAIKSLPNHKAGFILNTLQLSGYE